MSGVTVQRTKKHLIIKVPLEEMGEKMAMDEDDVLMLAYKGLAEYKASKAESFKGFVARKYPEYSKYIE